MHRQAPNFRLGPPIPLTLDSFDPPPRPWVWFNPCLASLSSTLVASQTTSCSPAAHLTVHAPAPYTHPLVNNTLCH